MAKPKWRRGHFHLIHHCVVPLPLGGEGWWGTSGTLTACRFEHGDKTSSRAVTFLHHLCISRVISPKKA
ncbi:MAG: hypothetical protein IJC18_05480 [Clostridia bacterium]|nr:hypothetical protein [Clostridia bacterium]